MVILLLRAFIAAIGKSVEYRHKPSITVLLGLFDRTIHLAATFGIGEQELGDLEGQGDNQPVRIDALYTVATLRACRGAQLNRMGGRDAEINLAIPVLNGL